MLYYKIYIVYRDFITTFIIGVLNFTITPISTFSSVSVSKIGIFYKIYIVYRDFITMLIFGVLSFATIPISTFTGAFASEIQ